MYPTKVFANLPLIYFVWAWVDVNPEISATFFVYCVDIPNGLLVIAAFAPVWLELGVPA